MFEKLLQEGRAIATPMAQRIADLANQYENPGQFAGLVASLTFQNIVLSIAWKMHRPGSPEGHAFIEQTYKNALQDAHERWNKTDLKAFDRWEAAQKKK